MARYVIVQKGDTLYGIAKKYECSIDEIRKLNEGMRGDTIILGQKLLIPSLATPATIPALPPKPAQIWAPPLRPWGNYNNRVGKFLDEAYFREIGADHNGADINGNGGGNSDWGDILWSMSSLGTVVGAVNLPVWGKIVKIDYGEVYASYAHLDKIFVTHGQEVDINTKIGTMGRGAGNIYLAHLHLEIEPKLPGVPMLPIGYWPARRGIPRAQVRQFIAHRYRDPIEFLRNKGAI